MKKYITIILCSLLFSAMTEPNAFSEEVMVTRFGLASGAKISLNSDRYDRFIFLLKGSLTLDSVGSTSDLNELDCVFVPDGVVPTVKASDDSTEFITISWESKAPESSRIDSPYAPGVVFSYRELQFCQPADGVNSRVVTIGNRQICFDRLLPGSGTHSVTHSTDFVTVCLRGSVDIAIDGTQFTLDDSGGHKVSRGQTLSRSTGSGACETIMIFSSPNPAYTQAHTIRQNVVDSIVAPGVQARLIVDGATSTPGLTFTEGPSWMNGKFYFSNYYKMSGAIGESDEGGLCTVGLDGSYEVLNNRIQTCGTTPLPNGNLAACDIINRKIVELSPSGEVLSDIAEFYNGIPFGMPNDLITDSHGGLYFTVPRIPKEGPKQPGSAVYYRNPEGDIIRVTEWDEFNTPNGCLVSPDGGTFYLGGSKEEKIWMYDIGSDGALSNKRIYADLIIPEYPNDKDRGRGIADGMTVDTEGNVYVATNFGIQIYRSDSEYLGLIYIPKSPAHCVFGGEGMSTLFITCKDRIYTIDTLKKGFVYPIQ